MDKKVQEFHQLNATVEFAQAEEKMKAVREINQTCWQIKAGQKILNDEGVNFREATIERYRVIKKGASEFKETAGEVIDRMRKLNELLTVFKEKFGSNTEFASTQINVGVRAVSEGIDAALRKILGTVLYCNDLPDDTEQLQQAENEDTPIDVLLAKVANWLANHDEDVWNIEQEKQSMTYADALFCWIRFAVQTLRNKGRTVQVQEKAAGNVC